MLTKPRFDEEAFTRIKASHLHMLKRRAEQPSTRLNDLFYKNAFANHPYARPHYGSLETIAHITADDLRDYMHNIIAREHMQLAVSGDINEQELRALLQKHLLALSEQSKASLQPLAKTSLNIQEQPVRETLPTPQTQIQLVTYGISRHDPQFYAAYVLNHALGGSGLSSKLGIALRQERGLTYSVGSSLNHLEAADWFSLGFATQTSRQDEAIDAAKTVLKQVSEGTLNQSDITSAKDYLTGSFPLALNSNSGRVSYLAMMQHYQLDDDYLMRRNDYINDVTLQQIQDVAKMLCSQPIMQLTIGESP